MKISSLYFYHVTFQKIVILDLLGGFLLVIATILAVVKKTFHTTESFNIFTLMFIDNQGG